MGYLSNNPFRAQVSSFWGFNLSDLFVHASIPHQQDMNETPVDQRHQVEDILSLVVQIRRDPRERLSIVCVLCSHIHMKLHSLPMFHHVWLHVYLYTY